jgi:hypothetical protein
VNKEKYASSFRPNISKPKFKNQKLFKNRKRKIFGSHLRSRSELSKLTLECSFKETTH